MNEDKKVTIAVIVLLFIIVACIAIVVVGVHKKQAQRAEMEDYKAKVKGLEATNWTVINMQETKVVKEEISADNIDKIKKDILSSIPSYEPYANDCLMIKNKETVSIDCKTIN